MRQKHRGQDVAGLVIPLNTPSYPFMTPSQREWLSRADPLGRLPSMLMAFQGPLALHLKVTRMCLAAGWVVYEGGWCITEAGIEALSLSRTSGTRQLDSAPHPRCTGVAWARGY